jgi:hypothetical protein
MPGLKRQRVRAKRGPMTGSARLRADVPGIHVLAAGKTWMAGTSPAMTKHKIVSDV